MFIAILDSSLVDECRCGFSNDEVWILESVTKEEAKIEFEDNLLRYYLSRENRDSYDWSGFVTFVEVLDEQRKSFDNWFAPTKERHKEKLFQIHELSKLERSVSTASAIAVLKSDILGIGNKANDNH